VFDIYGGKSAAQSYRAALLQNSLAHQPLESKVKEIAQIGGSVISSELMLKKRKLDDIENSNKNAATTNTSEKEKSANEYVNNDKDVFIEDKANGEVEDILKSQEVETILFEDHTVPDFSGNYVAPFWNRHLSDHRLRDGNGSKKITEVSWSLLTK
jgi:hypothetical protein